jgi:Fe2+ transport system protein B
VVPRPTIANHGKVKDAPVRLKDKGEVIFHHILGDLADEKLERLVKPLWIDVLIDGIVLAFRTLIIFLYVVVLASVIIVVVAVSGLSAVGRVARVGRPPPTLI